MVRGGRASSYDVYFGTDSTPDAGEFQGNQTGLAFDLGTLGAGTTYYWRIDSVNATGTTTGSVWSFTTAAGGGGPTTLFYDDFESGGLTAGGWIRQNTNSFASTAAEYTGAWGLRVRRTSYAYTNVSTAGFTDVRLRWARRTAGLDSSEWLWVEYWTGTAWSVVEQTKSTSWAYYEAALPADADNNPYFAVRFRLFGRIASAYARDGV